MTGDRYALYSGEDGLVVPMLSLGAQGVISVVSNLLPEKMSTMVHAYLDGDLKTARDIQISIIPLVNALFCEVNPIPVKEALNIAGWNVGMPRLPLCEMSEAGHKRMVEVLAGYDLSAMKEYIG